MSEPRSDAMGPRLIVALDFATAHQALAFAAALTPAQCRLKVGMELYTAAGPAIVEALVARGFEVFLDLKFHDIPQTVARTCAAAARLGVWMMNVHTLGGMNMLRAARDAVAVLPRPPLLIGVTVLTSHGPADLGQLGLAADTSAQVERLAALAKQAGLDGVVCSAQEARALRTKYGAGWRLVTPGIRPSGTDLDDQRRVLTPLAALQQGSDYLVIGRPITQAADPSAMVHQILCEIEKYLNPES